MINWLKNVLKVFGLEYFGKYYGVYKGFVVNNDDPNKQGRLIVRVPSVYGNSVYNYWAIPRGMYAGKGYGMVVLPEIGDAVFISFSGGDVRYPLWEHGWIGYGELEASTEKKFITTVQGHTIELDDKKDSITISKKSGEQIKIVDNNIRITADNVEIIGKTVLIKGAKAVPNVSGNLSCIPKCPYIGINHGVDKTITE